MSITGELRKWAGGSTISSWTAEHLTAIADRIDAKHQKAEDEWRAKNGDMWLKGYAACHEELMEGHPVIVADLEKAGWVKVPVDADGVPIHLGDKVYQGKGGWVYTVKSISFYPDNTTVTFDCEHGFGSDSAHNLRHYHAPTVEDVLREMVAAYMNTPLDDSNDDEFFAEYVDKLRLAGSDDE